MFIKNLLRFNIIVSFDLFFFGVWDFMIGFWEIENCKLCVKKVRDKMLN